MGLCYRYLVCSGADSSPVFGIAWAMLTASAWTGTINHLSYLPIFIAPVVSVELNAPGITDGRSRGVMIDLHKWTDPYTNEQVIGFKFEWAVASHEPLTDDSLDPTTQR